MRTHLACARARVAVEWLAGYDPDDGHGPIEQAAADESSMFTQSVVIAAFVAGMDQADSEFAVERATGQRQLDDAWALMAESAALFMGYAEHHQGRADEAERTGNLHAQRASLLKARANTLAALRLKEWMAGKDRFTVDADLDDTRGRIVPLPVPAEIADNGDIVPVASGVVQAIRRAAGGNVRPVSSGPLADPTMIENLVEALGGPSHCLSSVKAGAFRLQTGDPRFNPDQPVCVNGFLYTPATEA